jgi:hypothetical protein
MIEWLNAYTGGNKEGIWNVAVESSIQEDQKRMRDNSIEMNFNKMACEEGESWK